MENLQELTARVLPCPKNFVLLEDSPLVLEQNTALCVSSTGNDSVVSAFALRRLKEALRSYISKNGEQGGIPVCLQYADSALFPENPAEGYRLTVSGKGVTIEGYGGIGLLYGVITFCQLLRWQNGRAELPALQITDWPEKKVRGLFIETRYGTNMMKKEDWFQMLDDALEKKLNVMHLGLYGCWTVQYDGRVSEYLYVPVPDYPQLQTPMTVKYFSPRKQAWIHEQQLPPMFEEDFFGELVAYGKERGITVYPTWNSLGHNTLIPAQMPELSAKDKEGNPTYVGFCTSREETYNFLFSVYDHILDNYLLPSGVTSFCIGMDEVMDGIGYHADDVFKRRSPWCQCEKCRSRGKADIFVSHAVRQAKYLKQKGIKTISIYGDELRSKHESRNTVGCGERLMAKLQKEGLLDSMQILWWSYTDIRAKLDFHDLRPELGLRSIVTPMTGYYHWEALTHPMRNILCMAELAHQDHAEGMEAYSSWDRSYDRAYDAVAEFTWGFETAGSPEKITERYVFRNFPGREENAMEAIRLMELITEVRVKNLENPDCAVVSNSYLMRQMLNYYDYSYVRSGKPYPRNFPGEPLAELFGHEKVYKRVLLENSAMAQRAMELFESIAQAPDCNRTLALRFAYECDNYLCIARDWLAMLRMQALCGNGQYKSAGQLARQRRDARLQLMTRCEQVKEPYICKGLTMRNHSIFMQMFEDIAVYIETENNPNLNLLDADSVMSSRFWWLR